MQSVEDCYDCDVLGLKEVYSPPWLRYIWRVSAAIVGKFRSVSAIHSTNRFGFVAITLLVCCLTPCDVRWHNESIILICKIIAQNVIVSPDIQQLQQGSILLLEKVT